MSLPKENSCKCGHTQKAHDIQGKCSECDCKDFLKERWFDWLRHPKQNIKFILFILLLAGGFLLYGAVRSMFGLPPDYGI